MWYCFLVPEFLSMRCWHQKEQRYLALTHKHLFGSFILTEAMVTRSLVPSKFSRLQYNVGTLQHLSLQHSLCSYVLVLCPLSQPLFLRIACETLCHLAMQLFIMFACGFFH
jgi:hypothetical protein